ISFVANGGSEVAEITQDYGTEVVSPTDSNKTGHTFNGWYIDNNTFVNKYTFTTMPANGRVLYAKWTINQYIISFNANGGSQVNNITQDYGTVLPALDNSSKDYHTFNGWYTDNGTFKIEFSLSTMPANDVDLYAKWTANPYTISFETDGGSEIEAITQAYGTYLTAPTSIKAGYSLDGWYDDETLEIKYNFTTMPGYDFTLYARWTVNSYTISFDTNGGSVVEAITQDFGTELVIPNNPLKEGCVFKGWFTDNETFKDEYTFETVPNESFTLYAKWAKIYTITFDSNGGSEITEINTAVGDVLIAPDIPTKMGYTFNGWHTDNYTFLEEYEFSIMPEGSFTLYAKWLWSGQTLYAANGYYRIENCIWFGEYPQTLKASNITITGTTDSRGYYLGGDGYYYSKVTATPHAKGYKFSSNETVTSGTIYYFKVEPIKWRILNESEGTALILCDSIIKNKHYSYDNGINDIDNNSNDYKESEIRAWLNNEFYTTAFNTLQQGLINTTSIDNSPKSTGYMDNPYTCDNTEDKIFLPSHSEMVNADYCFNNDYMASDTARRRLTSDYSRATGVNIKTDINYYGNGYWWLRSPYQHNGYTVSLVVGEGHIGGIDFVNETFYGIVPALVISLPNQD
ncbi:MAG TPA: InlB B-repeat-containing protein, partial [Clostridia bacterium]|nr:InlB B-repeat-containing protein [Clostridia bacterium]